MEQSVSTKLKLYIEIDPVLWADFQEMMEEIRGENFCQQPVRSNSEVIECYIKQHLLHYHMDRANRKYNV